MISKVVVLLGSITKAQGQGQEDEGDRAFIVTVVLAMISAVTVMAALVKGLAALICRMKKMMDEDEVEKERPQNQPKDEVGKNLRTRKKRW